MQMDLFAPSPAFCTRNAIVAVALFTGVYEDETNGTTIWELNNVVTLLNPVQLAIEHRGLWTIPPRHLADLRRATAESKRK